ncbi:MAG: hypothetical protein R3A44_18025 [Caldilineaceae bacterium]
MEVITGLVTQYGQGKFTNDAGVRTYDNGYIVADRTESIRDRNRWSRMGCAACQTPLASATSIPVETNWEQLSPTARQTAVDHGWPGTPLVASTLPYTCRRTEGSGAMRRARSCAVLSGRIGGIDAQTMMAILSDHGDGVAPDEPFQTQVRSSTGICRHPEADGSGGCTAASLVADLCADGSRLPVYWCSFYSPCLGLFLPIFQ